VAAAPRGSRKPTPVQVVYFPKKGQRTISRVTQTIPAVEEPVTEVDHPAPVRAEAPAARGRSKKRTKSGSTPKVSPQRREAEPLSELAELGHELFSQGRVTEARAIFEGLVASSVHDGFARTMLGTICLALGDQDRAMALFEEALAIDPDDLPARVYRGEIRLNRRKVRLAAEDFQRVVDRGGADDPFVDRAQRLLKMAKRLARR